jgi:PRTRC genetic system protein E
MGMFKELYPLIKARPLTLTVVALEGDKIRVCVIPQGLEADKKINDKVGHHKEVAKIPESAIAALTTPLCLEGTGAELDAELADKLTKFSEAHGELRGALDRAQQDIADAVKAIDERNKAKSKTKPPAGKDDNKEANTKDSKAKDAPDTSQSGSLPLEWIAPARNVSAESGAADPKVSSKEVAAQ